MARGTGGSGSSTPSTCDRQDIDRIARIGVIASMQPYHAIDDGRWAEKRIGPERIKTTYAFRSLLDRHAHLGFGSDWTVAPLDPILGIYAAVTRRTLDGKHPERLDPGGKDQRRGGAPGVYRGRRVRRVRRADAGQAPPRLQGGSRAVGPGPDDHSSGDHRPGEGHGHDRGRPCRISIVRTLTATGWTPDRAGHVARSSRAAPFPTRHLRKVDTVPLLTA